MYTPNANLDENGHGFCSASSAVSWPAIIAGAVVAIAVSLALLMLGSSFGFAIVSPWNHASSAIAFTANAAIWLVIMQWVASGLGGYLAGRLRHRWANIHGDEVFFRDTAHGFITWALATIITVAFLASAASSIISGSAQTAAIGSAAAMASSPKEAGLKTGLDNPVDYYVDGLYRTNAINTETINPDLRAEADRLLMSYIVNNEISDEDKTDLAQLVTARTGLTPPEATERVNAVLAKIDTAKTKAKQTADKTRKIAAGVEIYTFLSFLIGAFIASVAAVLGGRRRDLITL